MFSSIASIFALVAFLTARVAAHGAITAVTGANGVTGAGFGIIPTTPRTGSTKNPFEQDTSIIRDDEIQSGQAGPCGRTNAGGNNDITTNLAAASAKGLPTAAADGTVTMTLHQVNGDGAGPYTCEVSPDGGQTFVAATVTQQVPGRNSRSRARAQDFTLAATMPAGMQCAAGPNSDACIMRCRNGARAGPFGGCLAIAAGGAYNATAAAAPPATAAPPAAAAAPPASAVAPPSAAAPPADTTSAAPASPAAPADTTSAAPADTSAVTAAAPAAACAAAPPPAAVAPPAAAAPPAAGADDGSEEARRIKKRVTISRIAGKRSGLWIDA